MDENFFTNESNINIYKNKNNYNEIYLETDSENDNLEIYDSLNEKSYKKNSVKNTGNITINNEDSVLEEAFNSLTNLPKKNKIKQKEKVEEKEKIIFKNDYSIDNMQDKISPIKKNNEEENVNLGISYSKISDPEKYIKNNNNNNNILSDENNNQGIITPNTSIYNISKSISKRSKKDYNNIEITSKDIINNIMNNQEENNKNSFKEDSLCDNYTKKNISDYNTYQKEDENKLMYDINCHFSNIKKTEENENNENNNNKNDNNGNDIDLNNIIKEKLSLRRNKGASNIISKRFELLKKNRNKKTIMNTDSSVPLNTISSNDIVKDKMTTNEDNNKNKILKNTMFNSMNEINNYIYLCPYCNKETPTIKKLEGIQDDIKSQTIDKISIICSCGNYELDLIEYINLLEQTNIFKNTKENCYNENHGPIKASIYCSKCNKWFCDQCAIFHKSLLADHITTPTKIQKLAKCSSHPNDEILFFCEKCNIGICEKCKLDTHYDHFYCSMNDYFNRTYEALPFKSFEELDQFIEHCNRISEKGKNSYINYIEDMINNLNELKKNIIDNFNMSKKRRNAQQKFVKYLFGNFICFNDNYQQIKNMNSINYICQHFFYLMISIFSKLQIIMHCI